LFGRQAGEESQLNQFRRLRSHTCESGQRVIEKDKLFITRIGGTKLGFSFQQVHPFQPASMPKPSSPSSPFDQNATHRLGCGGKEVAAAVPMLGAFSVD
jgi:hypothetical protein